MSTSTIGGFIPYQSDGVTSIAVYSTIANANADAAAMNAAQAAQTPIVITNNLVDPNTGTFNAQTALFVTPN